MMAAKVTGARKRKSEAAQVPVAAPVAEPAAEQAAERGAGGHADIRLWLRLLFCAGRIESVLQSRITGEFGITLSRFDLLAQLERVDGGLTMTEVSQRMMVSNGAITSLVDRLVDDGFVVREAHPQDRRTNIIRLTGHGRERFLAMAQEHERWVAGLLDGLDDTVKATLLDGLGRLKQHLEKAAA